MQGRLSGTTKGDLVEKFLAVRLEEVPGPPATRSRELRIVGEKSFPFPRTAWVRWRAAFAIGGTDGPKLDGSYNISSLGEGSGPQPLGTMGGGAYPGTPEARAKLEVWQADRSTSQVIWKRAWDLGPVRLRDAK